MEYITFEHIQKYFGKNHILKDISLSVEQGSFVTLLGPSGCGKSTLLRCLAGLEGVSGGRILLDDHDITDLTPQKREIGMVFQQYSLFPNMTVKQNIEFGLKIQKKSQSEREKAVKEALDLVGLQDRAAAYPNQLSGGQQQRVALARAIVQKPKVLLLDEPFSAIDALLRRSLQIEIRRIQQELGITTIFVTHDQDEAMVMSDKIYLFNDGHIEQAGTPAELYTHPHSHFAAKFIGNYNILSGSAFEKITGETCSAPHIAIRPELIQIDKTETEKHYQFKAIVTRNELHGNILRIHLDCQDISLHADMLFDQNSLFLVNSEVSVTIPRERCLLLAD